MIDVRCWYRDAAGELKPGRSGISVSIKHLPTLADALATALTAAREIGMLPPKIGEPPKTDRGAGWIASVKVRSLGRAHHKSLDADRFRLARPDGELLGGS